MKKMSTYFFYTLCLTLCLQCAAPFTSLLYAETGYVSDMLILSVREGPGRKFNILATLRSNAAVEIQNKKGGYLEVTTENGDKGWVESRYISSEIPKTMVIDQLKQELEQLKQLKTGLEQKNNQLKEEITNLETQNSNFERQNSDLADQNKEMNSNQKKLENAKILSGEKTSQKKIRTLEADLEAEVENKTRAEEKLQTLDNQYRQLLSDSENTVQITEENKILQQENQRLTEEGSFMSIFSNKDDVLKTAMIKWFLSGAGVMIAGWLIGRSFVGGGGSKRSGGLLG